MTHAPSNPTPPAGSPAQPPPAGGPPSLASQLGNVTTSPRDDLAFSRHVFRGEPCFIVRDPVTFHAHRFDPHQYETLIAIGAHDTLAESFQALVADGTLDADEEEDFYGFILELHRSGLLTLPVGDHKSLFKRYDARRKAEAKSKWMSPVFLRIPLCNPDAFFERITPFFRWMFTRWALAAWAALIVSAGLAAFMNRDNLAAPLLTALEIETLPLLWVLLIVLKGIHECGHGIACKTFGGKVPEIGVFLIAGTPAAYVDATASWGFHKVSHRISVSLAGMYFESICAAIALFVWAATPPGMINTVAFQTVIMASVVTIGFNINPLAKFDGYYLTCDLVGMPNLRQRASDELALWFDRVALGLKAEESYHGPFTRFSLLAYAVGAALYRVTLVLGISLMLASKAFVIGVAIAIFYAGSTVIGSLVKWARYLWFAPKTEPVRARGVAVSLALIALVVCVGALVPVPGRTVAPGLIAMENEQTVRAPGNGTVTPVALRTGAAVRPGEVIATLRDDEADLAEREAATALRVAELELRQAEATGVARDVAAAAARLDAARTDHNDAVDRVAVRSIAAERTARVLFVEGPASEGAFVRRGAPLARLGSGDWIATIYLDEQTAADAALERGTTLRAHPVGDAGRSLACEVVRIAASADSVAVAPQLAHTGGGTLMIDPQTGASARPLTAVTLRLLEPPADLASGSRIRVTIDTGARTLLASTLDNIRRLTDSLATR